ncbi:MAG: carbohydrate ABC transporter permease [Spirochaetaceae bacterium]|nr:carbohydrate ABC transporter permease [Spirochaetaceae bacterium]
MRTRNSGGRACAILRLSALAVVAFLIVGIPLWMVVVNSLKTQSESAQLSLGLPRIWHAVANYSAVIENSHYARSFVNSLVVTLASELLLFAIGAPAAWAFARSKAPGMKALYMLSIIGVVLPAAAVPMVFLMRGIHLQGSLLALVLFTVGMRVSLIVFLLTGFARGLPYALEEAAYIEGASKLRTFWSVVLPGMKSVCWTAFVIVSILIWNDFYGPLFLLTSKNATLPVGLYTLSSGVSHATAWNTVFAHVVLVSLPLIVMYAVAQRQIVEGVTAGALKD